MTVEGDWLRVMSIGGDDYECRMTILKADDTTIIVTRPWHHRWADGWDWRTIIRQWLTDAPETLIPYDGLTEWLLGADSELIDCWHCLSRIANHRRLAIASLSDKEKKRLASELGKGRRMTMNITQKDKALQEVIELIDSSGDNQLQVGDYGWAIRMTEDGPEKIPFHIKREEHTGLLVAFMNVGLDAKPEDSVDDLFEVDVEFTSLFQLYLEGFKLRKTGREN